MRTRRGATLIEAAAALVLMATAAVVLAQLLHAMAGQRRAADQLLLAQQVAAQQVEQWLTKPEPPLATDSTTAVVLPANVRDVLPESSCTWDTKVLPPQAQEPATTRLTVTVSWRSGSSQISRSVRMIGLRASSQERAP